MSEIVRDHDLPDVLWPAAAKWQLPPFMKCENGPQRQAISGGKLFQHFAPR